MPTASPGEGWRGRQEANATAPASAAGAVVPRSDISRVGLQPADDPAVEFVVGSRVQDGVQVESLHVPLDALNRHVAVDRGAAARANQDVDRLLGPLGCGT